MSKLETRLLEYEKNRQISSDSEFVAALEAIIAEESKKRSSRRDFELLEEAVSILTSLQTPNVDALEAHAAEVTKAAVYTATREEEKHYIPMRRLIPIAAAVLLLAAGMVAISANEDGLLFFSDKDEMDQYDPGVSYEKDENELIVSALSDYDIKELQELYKNVECEKLLLPFGLGKDYSINDISYDDMVQYKSITIDLDRNGSINNSISIFINKGYTVPPDETIRVGKFDVYVTNYDDIYFGTFEYNNCLYQFYAESQDILFELINSMKECKKKKKYSQFLY